MARFPGLLLALVLTVPSLEAGFAPPVNHAAGSMAYSVVVGDWNRDGEQDLAVANVGSHNISILLADGSGSFLPAVNYASGLVPIAITAGDFNRDAVPDLAVANRSSNNVSVYIGNGNGTFQAAAFLAAGTDPFSIGVGDFDGDGDQDIATPNIISDDFSIFRGNGDGSFQAAANYAAGDVPYSVVVGDFNQDGKTDLAGTNPDDDVVSIFLGAGDATFSSRITFPAGTSPLFMMKGDFNQDGRQDLVVLNGLSNLSVLLGNGDGTFQAPLPMFLAGNPIAVLVVVDDFDDDGKPDLAIAGSNAWLLRGNGDGTFQAGVPYPAGTDSRGIAVGDFDRDGHPDVAVANRGSNNVSILLNDAPTKVCALQTPVNYAVGLSPYAVALGDFNRDGRHDLVVANSFSDNVSVLLGNANGTFQEAPTAPEAVGDGPRSVAVGDWNRDGKQDLAVPNVGSDDVSILLGEGNGNFLQSTTIAVNDSPTSVAAGDFDRDGIADLAVVNNGLSNTLSILRGLGNGTFTSVGTPGVGAIPQSVAVGDFNRDGVEDLAVANSFSNDVSVLLGNGNATFQGAVNYAANGARAVAVGDFDRDGIPDLGVATYNSNAATVLRGVGNGTFQAGVDYAAGTNTFGLAVSDLDLDGIPDLAVANAGSSNLSVLRGVGDATFAAPVDYTTASGPYFIASADFDRNGTPDVAGAQNNTNNVGVLLNACRFVTSTAVTSSQNPSPLGYPVTFTATVTSGSGVPTGTVSFKDGAGTLGTGTLSGGLATFTTSALGLGNHPITAEYEGDATFAPSTSDILDQVVLIPGELSISKTDGQTKAAPGGFVSYTIVVANPGAFSAFGATVTDTFPPAITSVVWTCSGTGTCTPAGVGNISQSVDLPVGTSVTFVATGSIDGAATGLLVNTASVAAPATMVDVNLANNSATDATALMACGSEIILVPDGRPLSLIVPTAVPLWFRAGAQIFSSYTVEVQSTVVGPLPATLTLYRGDGGCGNVPNNPTDSSTVDPQAPGVARYSFMADPTETFFRARLVNNSGSPLPVTISWAETTLYSAAWSTNGSNETYYSIQNTTGSTLQGRLSLRDSTGGEISFANLTIPAGSTMATNTESMGVPFGMTGTASFSFNGPPGAINAAAAIASFATLPGYVQPVQFLAVRGGR